MSNWYFTLLRLFLLPLLSFHVRVSRLFSPLADRDRPFDTLFSWSFLSLESELLFYKDDMAAMKSGRSSKSIITGQENRLFSSRRECARHWQIDVLADRDRCSHSSTQVCVSLREERSFAIGFIPHLCIHATIEQGSHVSWRRRQAVVPSLDWIRALEQRCSPVDY